MLVFDLELWHLSITLEPALYLRLMHLQSKLLSQLQSDSCLDLLELIVFEQLFKWFELPHVEKLDPEASRSPQLGITLLKLVLHVNLDFFWFSLQYVTISCRLRPAKRIILEVKLSLFWHFFFQTEEDFGYSFCLLEPLFPPNEVFVVAPPRLVSLFPIDPTMQLLIRYPAVYFMLVNHYKEASFVQFRVELATVSEQNRKLVDTHKAVRKNELKSLRGYFHFSRILPGYLGVWIDLFV